MSHNAPFPQRAVIRMPSMLVWQDGKSKPRAGVSCACVVLWLEIFFHRGFVTHETLMPDGCYGLTGHDPTEA
jgi:hypothetical protein